MVAPGALYSGSVTRYLVSAPPSAQPVPGAVAVNAALEAAGIEMPFPERDVTLRFAPQEET